jgi:hypothetical protein
MDHDELPPGITDVREVSDLQIRLQAVKTVLREKLGATDEFRKTYYRNQVGCCTLSGGKCKKHVLSPPPLPPGLMCSKEYGSNLANIESSMAEKRKERDNFKKAYDEACSDETASGFLNDSDEKVPDVSFAPIPFP